MRQGEGGGDDSVMTGNCGDVVGVGGGVENVRRRGEMSGLTRCLFYTAGARGVGGIVHVLVRLL